MMIAWVFMKIISRKLWLPHRTFPQVPLIILNPSLQIALFILFFALAIGLLYKPLYSFFLWLFISTEIVTLLSDEIRWQPWAYQFLFILITVAVNKKNPRFAINSILLILASAYLFSGLKKINGDFLYSIWQRLILIRFFHLPASVYHNRIIYWSGLVIPLFEMASGLLILLSRQRKMYALLPIFIHIFIILFLSPLGISYNYTIIPWNIAMAAFIYILLLKNPVVFLPKGILYKSNLAISFVWIALPFAGIFGYWDTFFSSGVYSGNVPYMRIYLTQPSAVPPELQPYVVYSKRGHEGWHTMIDVHDWGMNELQVAVPPERRIYKAIEQSFAEKYADLKPVCVVTE